MKLVIAAGLVVIAAPVLGLALLAGSAGGTIGAAAATPPQLCMTSGPVSGLDDLQATRAREVVAVTQQVASGSHLPVGAQDEGDLIALMTAYTESTLHNYANPLVPASEA